MAATPPAYVTPPVPQWPAVVIKPETLSGIRTYQVNLILDIVFSIFALVIGLTALLVVPASLGAGLAMAAIIGAATCGLIIVFIINFIVSLMSVFKMHHGADEYGPEHARYARRGVAFKWIGTALSTLAAILVVYLLFIGTSAFFFPGQVPLVVYVPLLVTIFWTAGVTSKGQMYRYMVRALQVPQMWTRSYVASLSIPALGAVGIGVVGFVTVRVIEAITHPSSIDPLQGSRLFQLLIGGVFLPPGFALVGYVLFLLVYRATVERLGAGLRQLYATVPATSVWPGYPPAVVPSPAPAPTLAPPAAPPAAVPPREPVRPNPDVMSTCPQCGLPIPVGAASCMYCGARLRP